MSDILSAQIRDLLDCGALTHTDLMDVIVKGKKKMDDLLLHGKLDREKEKEEDVKNIAHQKTPMGLGKIGKVKIWPCVFRFKLFSKQEELVNAFTQTVEFNLKQNTIELTIAEGGDDERIYDWIKYMVLDNGIDELALTTYDGCGQPLYSIQFQGVKATNHKLRFDYSVSDITKHQLNLSFKSAKRTNLIKIKNLDNCSQYRYSI